MKCLFSIVPKVVRKCESKHWFSCGAEGRSGGRSVGVRSNFLGWVDLLTKGKGAPPTRVRSFHIPRTLKIIHSIRSISSTLCRQTNSL